MVLLVTGAKSFPSSAHWRPLIDALVSLGIRWDHVTIGGEPSPWAIDAIVAQFFNRIGHILRNDAARPDDQPKASKNLVDTLKDRVERLGMPLLSDYGVTPADFPRIVKSCRGGTMKTNPLVLTDEEVTAILANRI